VDKPEKRPLPWWFFALFIGIGLLFIVVGAFVIGGTQRFLATSIEADGRIVDFREHQDIDDDVPMYSPVVEFTAGDGQAYRFTSSSSSSSIPKVGRQVAVLYNPEQPRDAKIKSWTSLWMLPTIFIGLGSMLFLVGLALLLFIGRKPVAIAGSGIEMD
jgi:hypothetical protein